MMTINYLSSKYKTSRLLREDTQRILRVSILLHMSTRISWWNPLLLLHMISNTIVIYMNNIDNTKSSLNIQRKSAYSVLLKDTSYKKSRVLYHL
jgi:hypothetical protein